MGKGPTIQELAEKEKAFRDYLKQIRTELEKDKAKEIGELDERIKNYYTDGGWSYKPLMSLDNVEVQQISSWSLDNVVKIMSSVKDAIFGNENPPEGVEIEKPESFVKSLGELANLNLLVLSRAYQAIQGILQTFATESSFRGKTLTKTELVAPGMSVFISIRSDVWRNKGFFNNDSIAQYLFIVKSFFSIEQAGDLSKFNDLLAYEELKAAWRTRIYALAETIADPKTPFSALAELDQQLGFYSEKLADIQAKINELQTKEVEKKLLQSRKTMNMRIEKLNKSNAMELQS